MYVFMCVRVFFFTSCEERDPRFVQIKRVNKKKSSSAFRKRKPCARTRNNADLQTNRYRWYYYKLALLLLLLLLLLMHIA